MNFEKLGNIRLYEDDWSYSCGVDMKVSNGTVFVYEHNIVEKKPDCLRRILTADMNSLRAAMQVTDESFFEEMRERFGRSEGTVILREFLYKNGIRYSFQEFYNMFVSWEHLIVCHSQLDTSAEDFNDAIMEHPGISLCKKTENEITYKGDLPVFGPCNIHVVIPKELPVGHVSIVTERKVSEEEVLPMLEYMKQSMPCEPHYDDHGYGVMPKPHEIELVWEMEQGNVDMHWDGFNYSRGNEPNLPQRDGFDYVRIDLWDGTVIRRSRDEEYWRSEVD